MIHYNLVQILRDLKDCSIYTILQHAVSFKFAQYCKRQLCVHGIEISWFFSKNFLLRFGRYCIRYWLGNKNQDWTLALNSSICSFILNRWFLLKLSWQNNLDTFLWNLWVNLSSMNSENYLCSFNHKIYTENFS